MCSRRWVIVTPETCRAVVRLNKLCDLRILLELYARILLRCTDPWTLKSVFSFTPRSFQCGERKALPIGFEAGCAPRQSGRSAASSISCTCWESNSWLTASSLYGLWCLAAAVMSGCCCRGLRSKSCRFVSVSFVMYLCLSVSMQKIEKYWQEFSMYRHEGTLITSWRPSSLLQTKRERERDISFLGQNPFSTREPLTSSSERKIWHLQLKCKILWSGCLKF